MDNVSTKELLEVAENELQGINSLIHFMALAISNDDLDPKCKLVNSIDLLKFMPIINALLFSRIKKSIELIRLSANKLQYEC